MKMKLTIITINYNNREGLSHTLASVRSQRCRDFEYLVVDGGSSDGSRELILENEDIVSSWVSEPDGGIYNAMNKGVGMASGEYCLFLNSGDTLHSPDVVGRVLEAGLEADIVFGRVLNVWPDGRRREYVPSQEMTLHWIMQTGIHHAGAFIRTSLMRRIPYDESLRICADRKFFIRALVVENCTFSTLPFLVCDFEVGGVSSTSPERVREESWEIMESLFPPRLVADYRKTNVRLQALTEQLVPCRNKVIGLVCAVDRFILRVLRLLLGRRLYR